MSAPDPRRVAYDMVVAGVSAGLPIPSTIDIPTSHHIFELKMADNDRDSVDAWAAHLGLPAPSLGDLITGPKRDFRAYASETWEYPALPGWKVEVDSYIDEPAEGGTR